MSSTSVALASSKGSNVQNPKAFARGGNFQDDQKLIRIVKLYTTLENHNQNEEGSAQSVLADLNILHAGDTHSKSRYNRNYFLKIEAQIIRKIFTINHIVLINQSVSVFLFHCVLLLSFLQILFNIFYKVEIVNEFAVVNNPAAPLSNNMANITQALTQNTFRIDMWFQFINFQYYVIQGNDDTNYLMLYFLISGILILFIAFLVAISNQVFEADKTEDVKEGTKMALKGVSILMILFIFILQIPYTTLLLQGYLCGEDPSQILVLPSITCDSTIHILLIASSTIMLIIYLLFLVCQQVLYSSNSFEPGVPWGSFERTLALVRIMIKFIISTVFVFDKAGNFRGQTNLICCALQCYIVFHRFKTAIIFEKSVFYATIMYEVLLSWLYLIVGMHILAGATFSISSVSLVIFTGIALGCIFVIFQINKAESFVRISNTLMFQTPLQYMIYINRMYKLIECGSNESQIILQGKLRNHILHCDNAECICTSIAQSLDDFKQFKKLQQQEQDEEQAKWEQERSIGITRIDEMQDSHLSQAPSIMAFPSEKKIQHPLISDSKKQGSISAFQFQTVYSQVRGSRRESSKQSNEKSGGDGTTKNWLERKRRFQKLEERINMLSEVTHDPKKTKKKWYKMLAIVLQESIGRFPKNIDLKVINAFIQKQKLNNEFKAIFEMMNCEQCDPTIYEQFVIFRKKIEVEQTLIKQHQKNIQRLGILDVMQIYNYEKQFQQYQLYEYLTTNSALSFWKELLQKQINAALLQERGSEISKYYEIIQDVAVKLQAIYPDEIKFLFRYGKFLFQIIHNEYDALDCFRKAQTVFTSKLAKKGNSMPNNEQSIFGENSSSGIVIISATSTKIGIIIHANEEVEQIIGYKRAELIGRNISTITPKPIAKVHDKLVQRYFETAKPHVIEIKRCLFAAGKDGYLKEVELIVKVFPQVDDKIVFVGFMQKYDRFDDMEPPKQEYEKCDKQYILTDSDGNIFNVSEGLNFDLGLHAKFFTYSDSIFQMMFNIQRICPEIFNPEHQEGMELEGTLLSFDTRSILNNIELESLNSDEIAEVRARLGTYQANVQVKKITVLAKQCTIHIYRIILLARTNINDGTATGFFNSSAIANENGGLENNSAVQEQTHDSNGSGNNGSVGQSFSSMSSTQSGSFAFNRVIKDFKKALGDRKTPKNLLYLNRIMILILMITIALSSIDFATIKNDIFNRSNESTYDMMTESRSLKMIQLASNVRSFINIANGVEFNRYDGSSIQSIDRYEYLGRLIQSQAVDLLSIHQYISEQRFSSSNDYINDNIQNAFENTNITSYILDGANIVTNYNNSYRISLINYLNYILELNATDRSMISIPETLIINAPSVNYTLSTRIDTTLIEKSAYFLMVNGLRGLRTQSEASGQLFDKLNSNQKTPSSFTTTMILGIIVTVFSIGIVLYQVLMIEKNKAEILSLYALLQMSEINEVYQACESFLDILNQGSINSQVGMSNTVTEGFDESGGDIRQGYSGAVEVAQIGMRKRGGSQISEEDMQEEELMNQLQQKRNNKIKETRMSKQNRKSNQSQGHELYAEMIKRTFSMIKVVQGREQQQSAARSVQKARRGKGPVVSDSGVFIGGTGGNIVKKATEKQKHGGILVGSQPSQGQKKKKQKKERKSKNRVTVVEEIKEDHHHHDVEIVGENEESQSQPSHSENEDDAHKGHRGHRQEHIEKHDDEGVGEMEMSSIEVDERKQFFFKTIKTKNWGKILINLIFGLIFAGFFIQVYAYQYFYNRQLANLQQSLPVFLDRFRHIMLGFAFTRERIINNNTLNSFEYDPIYGFNLDQLYLELSMETENQITDLDTSYNAVIQNVVSEMKIIDSANFCDQIIGGSIQSQPNITVGQITITSPPYQQQLNTIVVAQISAINGDTASLKKLKDSGFDMDSINYDRRTALHFASKSGQLSTVMYLYSIGVKINIQDRWGATPLNYATPYPRVYSFLQSVNANIGTDTGNYLALASVYQNSSLQLDDYRSFYAAYFGDIQSLQYLQANGNLNVNAFDLDGRQALAVAASEGYLQAVQYLVEQGADMSIRDARGDNVLQDAQNAQSQSVVQYLQSIISDQVIYGFCIQFANGIFENGLQQAIGNFHNRFTNLQIQIASASSYEQLTSLLNPPNQLGGNQSYNSSSLQMFFSAQELYFGKVVDSLITVMNNTYSQYLSSYYSIAEIVFLIFLTFQLIILFLLRVKLISTMREDIFQSRGILNLIPDNFFEQNRLRVEKLIKKLKD